MSWNRRQFLGKAWIAGRGVTVGGVLVGTRVFGQSLRRRGVESELLQATIPVLAIKARQELTTLPIRAQENIRRYFHGRCLNVHGFVEEICSVAFGEKLVGCGVEARQQLLTRAFKKWVVEEVDVLSRIETVAQEIGQELDNNWYTCCEQIAESWRVTLDSGAGNTTTSQLSDAFEPLIRREITAVRQSTYPVGQRPLLSETVQSIGKSAIGLLPISSVSPKLALPLFLMAALRPTWHYVMGQLRYRPAAYQRSITSRLSRLGNRVGMEFQRKVRRRVADLHAWQESALQQSAADHTARNGPLVLVRSTQ